MILSDTRIMEELDSGGIKITPFRINSLGSNSYDVHLGRKLGIYKDRVLDAMLPNDVEYIDIPDNGYVLEPGVLYLGVTEEYTESISVAPWLDGKSSGGRLGINIHATAGRGDVGFKGHWTLEMSCLRLRPSSWSDYLPWNWGRKRGVRIYAGMPIGQLTYFEVSGTVRTPYHLKGSAKYANNDLSIVPTPTPSMMWRNYDSVHGTWG